VDRNDSDCCGGPPPIGRRRMTHGFGSVSSVACCAAVSPLPLVQG
jgi:hypothetical protein